MTNTYKQTNIDWMDKIPSNWEEVSLRGVFEDVKEQNTDGRITNSLSLMKDVGIIPYEEKGNVGNKKSDNIEKYKIVSKGDLVINKMNAVIGSLGVSRYEGLVSPVYFVLRINDDSRFLMKYFEYIFQTREVQKYFRTMASGIMEIREALDWVKFKNMPLPLPNIGTQEKIVNLLDSLDVKLASFIKKKERYIEILKEHKQTAINGLITKGIDPNVQMKNSEIEWMGEIPKHWNIKKLKFLLKKPLQYGANESGDGYVENSYRYIRITDFDRSGFLQTENKQYLSSEKASPYILNNGDLLFARSGATAGKVFLCKNLTEQSCFAGYLIKATCDTNQINSEYLYHYSNSKAYSNWISYTFIKSTIENISAAKYANLVVTVPPLKEQTQILKEIAKIEINFENIIKKAQNQIDLIKQYRQSLIYEFASGKRLIN